MKKFLTSLPAKLLIGVILGILAGQVAGEGFMHVIVTLKYILNQVIVFCVPLIIIGFIAPSITKLGNNASRMLGVALVVAYISSLGAALFSTIAGYILIPHLSISADVDGLKELPGIVFQLDIPQIMPVMSALVFSVLVGLAATWSKAVTITTILDEFQRIVLQVVTKVVIPDPSCIYRVYLLCTVLRRYDHQTASGIFAGGCDRHDRAFYLAALLYGDRRGLLRLQSDGSHQELRSCLHYRGRHHVLCGYSGSRPALCEKMQTSAQRYGGLWHPLFANIHLCGSVLTEVFFVMTVFKILYGSVPSLGTMILFCALLGIFAIGAPGVPGGTVMASLGLITGVLGFDETGTALMLTIFALQDSFGTACNVTGDGALTMMLTGMRRSIRLQSRIFRLIYKVTTVF